MHWHPRHTPILSLITDVTSDATACITAMQDQRIDGGFKTRPPRGLREMILLGKRGVYLFMSITKDGSRDHSKGSGYHNIFFLGEAGEEEREGKEKKIKGKVFMLAYIVSKYSHTSCEDENLRIEGAFTK